MLTIKSANGSDVPILWKFAARPALSAYSLMVIALAKALNPSPLMEGASK